MHGPPTVLVVDDDRRVRSLYATWLEDGYAVETAENGRAALSTVDDSVDVVLLDRRMPDLSGDTVLEEIRERGLRCRIAMVTAVDPDTDILGMGFDTYLTKPIDREELLSTVEMLLDLREYDDRLVRCFRLASKKSALEAHRSTAELADDPEYVELVEALEDLRADLVETLSTLSDDGFDAAFRELVDPTYPPGPSPSES